MKPRDLILIGLLLWILADVSTLRHGDTTHAFYTWLGLLVFLKAALSLAR